MRPRSCRRSTIPAAVSRSVLIPNERGLDRRWSCATTSTRSTSSCRRRRPTTAQRQPQRGGVPGRAGAGARRRGRAAGLRCEAVISVAFGCPYEGPVPPERVFDIAAAARRRRRPGDRLRRHDRAWPTRCRSRDFFDRGRRRAARRRADRPLPQHPRPGPGQRVRGAARPASPRSSRASASSAAVRCRAGATGNIATEDLVSMLHEMGVEHRDRPRRPARLHAHRPVRTWAGRWAATRSWPARSTGIAERPA